MIIRLSHDEDIEDLWKIYYDTTHIVNGRDYTPEQCERWAPSSPDLITWAAGLKKTTTFVAEAGNSELVGFAQVDGNGEIGLFYCRYDHIGRGIGKLLYSAIENEAKTQGLRALTADVSITAKAFFLSRGFEVLREQQKVICGAPAPNFVMRKILATHQ